MWTMFQVWSIGVILTFGIWAWLALRMIDEGEITPMRGALAMAINTLLWPWSIAMVAAGVVRGLIHQPEDRR